MIERLRAMQALDHARLAESSGTAIIPNFGSPILVMPAHVREAATEAALRVHDRDTRGSHELRVAVAEHLAMAHGVSADPDRELLITHGAMHGLGVVFRALLSAGDDVVVPAPTFFYDGSIRAAGGRPIYVDCRESARWAWDLGRFDAAVTSRTRAVVVCNPTNPTGFVPRADDVAGLVEWAASRSLLVIADESYARFVYGGRAYAPQMALRDRYERMVTVTSLSKNYGFTNWRIGYVHAASALLSEIHRQFEWDALDVGPVPQAAARAVITGPQAWIESVLATYEPNRDRLQAGLEAAGLHAVPPAGGPFTFVDLGPSGRSGRDLEAELLRHGLSAVAGDAFMGPPAHARVMFGGSLEIVDAVVDALQRIVTPPARRGSESGRNWP